MVTCNSAAAIELMDDYEEAQQFEHIRPRREGPMPVGKSHAAILGRKRRAPNRAHPTPEHRHGITRRRRRKWM